jgi:pyruvate/2-oxoglutarate dehydrogenase complex dihydrolipoamide dehydrogenase (E3) component
MPVIIQDFLYVVSATERLALLSYNRRSLAGNGGNMRLLNQFSYDLVILGGGSGGLTAARLAASLGARTLLIEKERLGGECLHSGCVPSKSLIHVARLLHQTRDAQRFLGRQIAFDVTMPQVATYIQEVIGQVQATEEPYVEGVSVRFGTATFQSPTTLLLNGEPITSYAVVIATGSRPTIPAIPGLIEGGYLTNETVFDLTALPSSLAVIGGGPVGVELGQAFARLGSKVTIVQRAERLLPREDPDVSSAIASTLQADGVTTLAQSQVTSVSRHGQTNVLTVRQDQQECHIEVEAILLAVGRRPNVEGLNLKAVGVACCEQGIVVDAFLRTSAPHIFAIGDVIRGYHFSHVAAYQAAIAVRNALVPFGKQRTDERVVPWCTFTDPEAARVGLTPAEARERYPHVRVITFPYAGIDRARTDNVPAGFLKLVLTGKREEIVGAHLVGAHAGELIGELGLAMRQRLPLSVLRSTIHTYPTLSTGIQQLAFEAYLQGTEATRNKSVVQALLALRRFFAGDALRSSAHKEQL